MCMGERRLICFILDIREAKLPVDIERTLDKNMANPTENFPIIEDESDFQAMAKARTLSEYCSACGSLTLSSKKITKPCLEAIQTVLTTSPNRTCKQSKPYSICTQTKIFFLSFSVGLTRITRSKWHLPFSNST